MSAAGAFTQIANLADAKHVPDKGTLSQTLYMDDLIKVVLFGFAPGEELSEHTASMPAIMHFISGKARVTVGDETLAVEGGAWIHMRPHTKHSIRAEGPLIMLLTLVRAGKTA